MEELYRRFSLPEDGGPINGTAQAGSDVAARSIVAEGLEAQRQSVSGVNVDEEAINLLAFQRAFQASARFLTVVDELMGTLLGII